MLDYISLPLWDGDAALYVDVFAFPGSVPSQPINLRGIRNVTPGVLLQSLVQQTEVHHLISGRRAAQVRAVRCV